MLPHFGLAHFGLALVRAAPVKHKTAFWLDERKRALRADLKHLRRADGTILRFETSLPEFLKVKKQHLTSNLQQVILGR